MKQVMRKNPFKQPFPTSFFFFFFVNFLKIYFHVQKKSLMKPNTFDFKSLPTFPATTIPHPLSSHAFK